MVKHKKEFKIRKGEDAVSGKLNSFLDGILEEERSFLKGKRYAKNYKVTIIIEELNKFKTKEE